MALQHRFLTHAELQASLRWGSYARRLAWCHGPKRASAILSDEDEASHHDVDDWNDMRQDRS